jgi:tRNA A-37 threonylcarbamoyl transferase component Bud32
MKLEVAVPEMRDRVEAWLRGPDAGETVKDNRVRSVHRWNGLFVKRFKYAGLVQRLRGLVADRAAHEFRMLRALRERGIPAAEPVAWARRDGHTFLFTREIPGAEVLRSRPLTRPVLRELARFVRRLHDAGFRHDDLHVGNILVAGGELTLVDVHRAALVDALTRSERAESLAFVILSFYTFVSETDVLRFVREYGADPREVGAAFRAARERYFLDRQSRVRRTGSDFEVVDGLVLRRPTSAEEARRVLSAPPLRVVKEVPGRRLWLTDPDTFVKEGAKRLWENAFGLETRGIPTPRLIACAGDRVAGRWVEGALPLWEHLKAHGVSRDLVGRLARLVRRMHARGVYHRDLKANNLLVRGDEIYVVDLDRVSFSRDVPRADRVWNLAQLNAAVGAPVTRADRLRFFFAYAGRDRSIRMTWKDWVRDVMRKTRERRHVWP